MKFEDLNKFDYISTQPLIAGFDEIQQLFLSYCLGNHIALSGPPGVGKTTFVEDFADKVGLKMVSRVMGPKVNEAILISYPDLVAEGGNTVTVTRPGLLAKALQENALYFADEIDRLSEDNQKLHNSAFDNRRSVTLRDGSVIKGGDDFFGVVAYNPTEGMKNDLESALADRFVHLNFEYFLPQIEAMVSLQKANIEAGQPEGCEVTWKAIRFVKGAKKQCSFFDVHTNPKTGGVVLIDPYKKKTHDLSNAKASAEKNSLFVYQCLRPVAKKHDFISAKNFTIQELGLKISELCADVRNLSLYGMQKLDGDILSQFKNNDLDTNLTTVKLHMPSSRIQQAALSQYNYLTQTLDVPASQAQEYAFLMVINQAAYGKFGLRKSGAATNRQLLLTLAGAKGLLPMRRQKLLAKSAKPTAKPKAGLFGR